MGFFSNALGKIRSGVVSFFSSSPSIPKRQPMSLEEKRKLKYLLEPKLVFKPGQAESDSIRRNADWLISKQGKEALARQKSAPKAAKMEESFFEGPARPAKVVWNKELSGRNPGKSGEHSGFQISLSPVEKSKGPYKPRRYLIAGALSEVKKSGNAPVDRQWPLGRAK